MDHSDCTHGTAGADPSSSVGLANAQHRVRGLKSSYSEPKPSLLLICPGHSTGQPAQAPGPGCSLSDLYASTHPACFCARVLKLGSSAVPRMGWRRPMELFFCMSSRTHVRSTTANANGIRPAGGAGQGGPFLAFISKVLQ